MVLSLNSFCNITIINPVLCKTVKIGKTPPNIGFWQTGEEALFFSRAILISNNNMELLSWILEQSLLECTGGICQSHQMT